MTIRICTNARVMESAFRYNTALGIDDLLRAYTYESVVRRRRGDLSRRGDFFEEK